MCNMVWQHFLTKIIRILLLMMCAGWIACAYAPSAEQHNGQSVRPALPVFRLNFEPKNVIAMTPVTFNISVEKPDFYKAQSASL